MLASAIIRLFQLCTKGTHPFSLEDVLVLRQHSEALSSPFCKNWSNRILFFVEQSRSHTQYGERTRSLCRCIKSLLERAILGDLVLASRQAALILSWTNNDKIFPVKLSSISAEKLWIWQNYTCYLDNSYKIQALDPFVAYTFGLHLSAWNSLLHKDGLHACVVSTYVLFPQV